MVKKNQQFDAGYIYAPFVPIMENNIKTRWRMFRLSNDPNYRKKKLSKNNKNKERLKELQKTFLYRMKMRYTEDKNEYFCIAEMIVFTPDIEISWNAVADSLVKENYVERHILENFDYYFSFKIKGLWWCFRMYR